MKRLICYIVTLFVVVGVYAVDFRIKTTAPQAEFRSTSAYIHRTMIVSQPQQTVLEHHSSSYTASATTSFTVISAANFQTLNTEGGLCYQPTSGIARAKKVTRPDDDDEDDLAIGEIVEHSPVGEMPFILMAIMASLYGIYAKKRKKSRKNLVES